MEDGEKLIMKSLVRFLAAVRNLPEEVRKLLAGFFLLIAAVLLFNNWTTSVSSKLTQLSVSPPDSAAVSQVATPSSLFGNKEGEKTEPAAKIPPPLESIADSVKSLEKLIQSQPTDSVWDTTNLKQKINNLAASLYEISEKIWKYIYNQLKDKWQI